MSRTPDDSDDAPSVRDLIYCSACQYDVLHKHLKRHRESGTHAHCRTVKARRDAESAAAAAAAAAAEWALRLRRLLTYNLNE